jgi:hypothetical protein
MTDDNYSARDEQGRFLPGNPGGPGRPSRGREQAVLDAMKEEFTPAYIVAKLKTALEKAEAQGSPRAMATVLDTILAYTVGKPSQSAPVQSEGAALLAELLKNRGPVLPPRMGTVEVLPGPSRLLEQTPGSAGKK